MNTKLSPLFAAISLALATALSPGLACGVTVDLRVIETTDIHANVLDFDFYKGAQSNRIGLVRTATLVEQARAQATNSVLVDNGDLIQGSPMGDWRAAQGLQKGDIHPAHKVMNAMGYDIGNIGNHEFNYGLDYLKAAVAGASFPYVCANVQNLATDDYLFDPYLIREMKVSDNNGDLQTIKVGYIGFVPPQIMVWDRENLAGKVFAMDITTTARQLVPEMKQKGADVIIALAHSGLSSDPYRAMAENSVYYLSEVEGIDAIMFGHSHAVFPSAEFSDIPKVDIAKGTINGVPAVMPGRWGSHIGIVDLKLDNSSGSWEVVNNHVETRAITKKDGSASVKADPKLSQLVEQDRLSTVQFLNRPIGRSSDVMYSFLALVQDDPTIQIVNQAQIAYVKQFIQGEPDLAGLPVLSATAPFKAGGRKNDPTNYTEVESGAMTFRNAADLYPYPNTLTVLKVTGAELREWLERSAGMFNRIDPESTDQQALLNWETFRTYNYDVIDGVKYQIDVTQPSRYNEDGKVVNQSAHRIQDLSWQGKPVTDQQIFLIATNNYRASGGGNFPAATAEHVAFHSPDETRSILASYIQRVSEERGSVIPTADGNWRFTPIQTSTELNIVFETANTAKANTFVKGKAKYPVVKIGTDTHGFAVYSIDLVNKL